MANNELVSSLLDCTVANCLDFIDYDEQKATIAYFDDYHTLSLSPLPHRNAHKFFGMGKKRNYLAWIEYLGTFTAVHQNGVMSTWSKSTGKVLSQNNRAHRD